MKEDLEYNDTRSGGPVAVYMFIPFGENVTFYDSSQLEQGAWVYKIEDVPTEYWMATRGVRVRFIDRKSSGFG